MTNVLCMAGEPLKVAVVGEVLRSYLFLDRKGHTGFRMEVNLFRERDRVGFGETQARYNPYRREFHSAQRGYYHVR